MQRPILIDPIKYLDKIVQIIDNDDVINFADSSFIYTPPILLWNPDWGQYGNYNIRRLEDTARYYHYDYDLLKNIKDNLKTFYGNMQELLSSEFFLVPGVFNELKQGYVNSRHYLKRDGRKKSSLIGKPQIRYLEKLTQEKHSRFLKKKRIIIKLSPEISVNEEKSINYFMHEITYYENDYINNILKKNKTIDELKELENENFATYNNLYDLSTQAYAIFVNDDKKNDSSIISEVLLYSLIMNKNVRLFTFDTDFSNISRGLHSKFDLSENNKKLHIINKKNYSNKIMFYLQYCLEYDKIKVCTPEDGSINPEQLIPGFPPLRGPQSTNTMT